MPVLTLHGYRYSVYTRVARLALYLKSAEVEMIETDPFADPPTGNPHPFGRVPVLTHGTFRLYETAAITRYVDRMLPGPSLMPGDAQAQARADQIMSIVDAYAYWPLVRQVFAQRVFRPFEGERPDEAEITRGLAAAVPVLAALEDIAQGGAVLTGEPATLADLHLAPMIAAFTMAPEGVAALAAHPALSRWWSALRAHPMMAATDPDYPALRG